MAEALDHWFERYRGLAVTHCSQRQLCRRHDMPPLVQGAFQDAGCGHTPYRHRHFFLLGGDDDRAAGAAREDRRGRTQEGTRTARAHARSIWDPSIRDVTYCRRQTFRCIVAWRCASPHRRLLTATSVMAWRRRPNAVADDGVRRRDGRLGFSRRTETAAPERC